jgi:SAM-dependent methyltransferase
VPSPNLWHHPEVYEVENRAHDADGALAAVLAEVAPWDGLDVLDVGCGDGFHLPRFAATAASTTGVEPHPPLVERARRRVAGLAGVRVLAGQAEALPVPGASVDVVHARTAYFFGPGCEPGLREARRVLRPGGVLVVVDLDATRSPYGAWMRADLPRWDAHAPARFFAAHGFTQRSVDTRWVLPSREALEAVLGIEFSPAVAAAALARTPGLTVEVAYRVSWRRTPAGLARP